MSKPNVLIVVEESHKYFAANEMKALRESGLDFWTFPLIRAFHAAPPVDHGDSLIFLRTSVPTADKYEAVYSDHFLNRGSSLANRWYELPRDERWDTYFKRQIVHLNIDRTEDDYEVPELLPTLRSLEYQGNVFVKSTNKSSFKATLFVSPEAADLAVREALAFGCHRMPSSFLVSEPVFIDAANTDFKKHEYRIFIIGGKVATASIFSDKPGNVVPSRLRTFANQFAKAYEGDLPSCYCLDVALAQGKPIVVELNDIHASGLFADHDMQAFYQAIKNLALEETK